MAEPGTIGDIALQNAEEGKRTRSLSGQSFKGSTKMSMTFPQPESKIRMEPELLAREWQHVLGNFQKKDNAMIKDFNEEIDTLLVFAGLFSAVLTAFIIEVYKLLGQDQSETSAILLRRISMQFDQASGQSPISLPSSTFRPSKLIVAVNVLWFVSLLFSLFAALVAILAKQWIHIYSKWDEGPSDWSKNKLFLRGFYQQGLTEYHIPEIIGVLPVFLQIALLLFVVGLTLFLWHLESVVLASIVTSISAVGISLAFYTIVRPIFDRKCMYKTPLAIFAAAAWDTIVNLKSSSDTSEFQENTTSRSYTRWRDHDSVVAKKFYKHQSPAESILAQISLVSDVRPPITWATLRDRVAIPGILELDSITSKLVNKLMVSLLYTASEENRNFFLHENSAPLYRAFLRRFPPPNLKLLAHNLECPSFEQESALDKDVDITIALVKHLGSIHLSYLTDDSTIVWGLHLLCVQLETLISSFIFEEPSNESLEKMRLGSSLIWPTFENWLQKATMIRDQESSIVKPQETLLLDCFLSKNNLVKNTKLILEVIRRLEQVFPETAQLNAAVIWRLRLLNESTDTIIKDPQRAFSRDTIVQLQSLADTLYYWIGVATNQEPSPVVTSSVTLLEALFDLITSSTPMPCSLEQLMYVPSNGVSLCLSSDGMRLATGDQENLIHVWDFADRRTISTMRGHTGDIISMSFSKDGTHIASGSMDHSVRIWNTETGKELHLLQGHQQRVIQVAFSPDGSKLISCSSDKTAIIWNCAAGLAIHTLIGHTDKIRSAAFSHDELRVATASDDNTIRIWETDTGLCVDTVNTGHSMRIAHVEFVADSYHLLSQAFKKYWNSQQNWERKYFKAPHYDIVQAPSELEDTDSSLSSLLAVFDPHTRYLVCWEPEARQFQPILKLPETVVVYSASYPHHYFGHHRDVWGRKNRAVYPMNSSLRQYGLDYIPSMPSVRPVSPSNDSGPLPT